jgi:hypothetical protein
MTKQKGKNNPLFDLLVYGTHLLTVAFGTIALVYCLDKISKVLEWKETIFWAIIALLIIDKVFDTIKLLKDKNKR